MNRTTTAIVNAVTVADCSMLSTVAWAGYSEPGGPPAWNNINVIRDTGVRDIDERDNIRVSDVVLHERCLDDLVE